MEREKETYDRQAFFIDDFSFPPFAIDGSRLPAGFASRYRRRTPKGGGWKEGEDETAG